MRFWNAVNSREPGLAHDSSAALHDSHGEWLDVEAAIVQRARVRNLSSETQIPPLPSSGNLGFRLRASTSPSAWGTQALLGCLHLAIASFNHPFLWGEKMPIPNKIYWSITMTANIRSSSPNKKSSGNIPRDKIPSSAPFSAMLETHFKLSTIRVFWHRLRKKWEFFLFQVFFFFWRNNFPYCVRSFFHQDQYPTS